MLRQDAREASAVRRAEFVSVLRSAYDPERFKNEYGRWCRSARTGTSSAEVFNGTAPAINFCPPESVESPAGEVRIYEVQRPAKWYSGNRFVKSARDKDRLYVVALERAIAWMEVSEWSVGDLLKGSADGLDKFERLGYKKNSRIASMDDINIVPPEFRRRGLGKAAYRYAFATLQPDDLSGASGIPATEEAKQLMLKTGFRDEGYYHVGSSQVPVYVKKF